MDISFLAKGMKATGKKAHILFNKLLQVTSWVQCVRGNLGSSEMDETGSLNSRWLQFTRSVAGKVNRAA